MKWISARKNVAIKTTGLVCLILNRTQEIRKTDAAIIVDPTQLFKYTSFLSFLTKPLNATGDQRETDHAFTTANSDGYYTLSIRKE